MTKHIIYWLSVVATCAGAEGSIFQQMDNQIGIGYSYVNNNAYNPDNPYGKTVSINSDNLALHLEQLFDSNVWLAIDGNFAFSATQNSPADPYEIQSFGFPASISGKGGYSFNWSTVGLQVIPYAMLGRALNYNNINLINNGFANSFYNVYGAGGRIEYVFVPGASIYFDQNAAYLQDPTGNTINQSMMSYTSTLGLRYNISRYFQIGLQGAVTYAYVLDQSYGYNSLAYVYTNTTQMTYAGMVNFAYLFDNDRAASVLDSYHDNLLAQFDNNYSIGMGFANATNSYSAGVQKSISSSVNYFNFGISHLFDNNVWANLNAQLINGISQTNVPPGRINSQVPTYVGFPGNVNANVGYAFGVENTGFQVIPYGNLALIMDMNSYNVRHTTNLMSAISQNKYLQYGAGARVEYAFDPSWQIYGDQLLAQMQDRSSLAVNAWHLTSAVGVNYSPVGRLQLGLKGYYDMINPENTAYNPQSGYMALQQQSLGLEFDIGLRY